MKSPTIKDVAEAAGVSVATVSRVLNGNAYVKSPVRQRVMATAEELNYRPNRIARSLRTQRSKTIAVVVPDIQNRFFVALERGLEDYIFGEGYTVLVCNTGDDPDRESLYLRLLVDEAVAGIAVCATDEHRSAKQLLEIMDKGVALVAVDRRLENAPVDFVLSDNIGGASRAVSYLIEQGHRRIGLIAGPNKYTPAIERRMGYEQALLEHGLPIDPQLIADTNYKSTESEIATRELLTLHNPPTALFLSSGNVAIGSLKAIYNLGLRIPEDISLVVFDDPDWAEAHSPPLTVIAQDTHVMGKLTGELLLSRIRGNNDAHEERRLPTQLIIRKSVRQLNSSGLADSGTVASKAG